MADYIEEEFERRIAKVVNDEFLARKLIALYCKYEFIIGILYNNDGISDFFEDKDDYEKFIAKRVRAC